MTDKQAIDGYTDILNDDDMSEEDQVKKLEAFVKKLSPSQQRIVGVDLFQAQPTSP